MKRGDGDVGSLVSGEFLEPSGAPVVYVLVQYARSSGSNYHGQGGRAKHRDAAKGGIVIQEWRLAGIIE